MSDSGDRGTALAADEHRRVWETIPWLVNGRATGAERRLLDNHLAACAECRQELARQRELHAAIAGADTLAADASGGEAELGLQRLFARIDRSRENADGADGVDSGRGRFGLVSNPRRDPLPRGLIHWLAAAVMVEALALAALGIGFIVPWREPAPPYVTLGDGRAGGSVATIRIVPSPGLRVEDLQRLLQALNLQVVAGPSSAGAYDLAPRTSGPARELQIASLRAEPGLRLVEPIDAPGPAR